MKQTPSIGRIVQYTLAAHDVTSILAQRSDPQRRGFNPVLEGQVYPAIIVRTWGSNLDSAVQLQVFLDGADTYWATSRTCGEGPGHWQWPPYVPAASAGASVSQAVPAGT